MAPRCDCAAGTCACLIADSATVTVTGHGTTTDPYRLAADIPALIAVDTDTVDMGVVMDEAGNYEIAANSTLGMTELSDVVDDDLPSVGDVPVWTEDGWVFSPPATSGQSLASGVWGTPPLDTATYGSNSLIGREIYIDSAGKARAEPDVITGLAAQFPVTALPTVYPTGHSVMYVSNADGVTWPSGVGSNVVTHKTSNNATLQWCTTTISAITRVWVRYGTGTQWYSWKELSTGMPLGGTDGQVLTKQSSTDGDALWEALPPPAGSPPVVTELAVVDLNSITASGFYTQSSNAEATSGTNYPVTLGGQLEVTATAPGPAAMVWQRYTAYSAGGATAASGVTYTRGSYQGVWTPWVSLGYVSGVWGTDPLLAAYYGSNSTVGREVYRDTAGQLRTKPESIAPTAANFPPTALITAYPFGMTSGYIGGVDGAAWPIGSSATLVTWRTSANSGAQWVFASSAAAAGARAYYRNGTSSNWGGWVDVVGPGLNKKMAAGRVTITVTSSMTGSIAITFPTGVFTTAPRVSLAVIGSSVWVPYSVNAPTATTFTAGVRHVDATVSTGTANVDWIAIEE